MAGIATFETTMTFFSLHAICLQPSLSPDNPIDLTFALTPSPGKCQGS
jgi:hypothetical protein